MISRCYLFVRRSPNIPSKAKNPKTADDYKSDIRIATTGIRNVPTLGRHDDCYAKPRPSRQCQHSIVSAMFACLERPGTY